MLDLILRKSKPQHEIVPRIKMEAAEVVREQLRRCLSGEPTRAQMSPCKVIGNRQLSKCWDSRSSRDGFAKKYGVRGVGGLHA